MQKLATLDDVLERYDALFCDVWGVIHNGRAIFPEAAAALQRARRAGKRVILLTNIPKPRDPIPRQLERLGFPADAYDSIVTSGDAIRAELAKRAPGPFYKIGPPRDAVLWEGLGLNQTPRIEDAAFVAISGLDDDRGAPEAYAPLLRQALARKLDLLCANPDIVVRFGGELLWCAGAVARDYAAIGGVAIMAGKPHAPIYDLARRELGGASKRILCIGDGAGTDVKGANAQGLDCLFIASGMHGEALLTDGALDPAKAEAALAQEGARAAYVMTALR